MSEAGTTSILSESLEPVLSIAYAVRYPSALSASCLRYMLAEESSMDLTVVGTS